MTIRIAEFKAHLSRYLTRVRAGESLTILDRDTPVATVHPIAATRDPWERLSLVHAVRLGTQDWKSLTITRFEDDVDAQALLAAVREDRV